MLKYSGAPLKMLLEVTECSSSELTPANKIPIYIIKKAQYKSSNSVCCQGRSNKNFWQSCGVDTFSKRGRDFKGIRATAFLFVVSGSCMVAEVNLPLRDLKSICLWLVLIILTPEALCVSYCEAALPSNGDCSYSESSFYSEGLSCRKAVKVSSEFLVSGCSSPAPKRTMWFSTVDTQLTFRVLPVVSTRC